MRLLIAVLTLMGPVPLRACTCAASHANRTSLPDDLNTPEVAEHGQSCSCVHDKAEGVPLDDRATDSSGGHRNPAELDGTHQPVQHERDCPAVSPRPLVREAVSQPATDAPTAGDAACPLAFAANAPSTGVLVPPSKPLRTTKTPLYLTLLTLRN
ncbi:MAG: hypothetical protein J0I06_24455 [Planctomycetes bacterium]|nr:hypothetical protein [Planctomycetota bacterium]